MHTHTQVASAVFYYIQNKWPLNVKSNKVTTNGNSIESHVWIKHKDTAKKINKQHTIGDSSNDNDGAGGQRE